MNVKKFLRDNRGFLAFIVLLAVFRTAIADWNTIPSGSMRPTLLEGDVVLVNRLAYDLKLPLSSVVVAHLGEPQRGDVVTFSSPVDGTRLIKRVIALPGDLVEMRDKKLLINGMSADYRLQDVVREPTGDGMTLTVQHLAETLGNDHRTIQWVPDMPRASTFGPVVVPADQYLMLGDNRDNTRIRAISALFRVSN